MSEHDDSEKTEEPTHRKLEEAQKKGDVVKSQEISTWFVMLGAAVALALMGTGTATSLSGTLKIFISQPEAIPMDADHLRKIWLDVGGTMFSVLLAPLSVLILAALIGNVIQHAPVFTADRMKPKLSKISPKEGMKRLFGAKSLMNLAKENGVLTKVTHGTTLRITPPLVVTEKEMIRGLQGIRKGLETMAAEEFTAVAAHKAAVLAKRSANAATKKATVKKAVKAVAKKAKKAAKKVAKKVSSKKVSKK